MFRSLREVLVDYVAKLDYSYNICMLVAETFRISTADLVQNVLDDTFSIVQNSVDREIILDKLIHLALDSSVSFWHTSLQFSILNLVESVICSKYVESIICSYGFFLTWQDLLLVSGLTNIW